MAIVNLIKSFSERPAEAKETPYTAIYKKIKIKFIRYGKVLAPPPFVARATDGGSDVNYNFLTFLYNSTKLIEEISISGSYMKELICMFSGVIRLTSSINVKLLSPGSISFNF